MPSRDAARSLGSEIPIAQATTAVPMMLQDTGIYFHLVNLKVRGKSGSRDAPAQVGGAMGKHGLTWGRMVGLVVSQQSVSPTIPELEREGSFILRRNVIQSLMEMFISEN